VSEEKGSAGAIDRAYRRRIRDRLLLVVLLAAATVVGFGLDLVTGPASLAWTDVLRALLDPDALPTTQRFIVWDVRLPAALGAVLVGSALSVAGAAMQTILHNPLASPFTLGVSAAATLGAALAIALGVRLPGIPDGWIISVNAFAFAFGSVLLLQGLAKLRGAGSETLVLFGIALVFAFNAVVGLIQFVSSQEALQQLVFWSLGSLGRVDWPAVRLLALVVAVTLPFSYAARWRLTAPGASAWPSPVSASRRSCGSACWQPSPSLSSGPSASSGSSAPTWPGSWWERITASSCRPPP